MNRFLGWVALFWITLAPQVQAGDNPVVVELFTSQGCSSCPPADALMHKLSHRDDVIPLALHVDYWDYIGWKDKFASPENTQRQRLYARASGRRSIYTPQMIVNGQEDVVGNRPMDVADLIRKHAEKPSPVRLDIRRDGGALHIAARAAERIGAVDVHVVRYDAEQTVDIKRGENAGRSISYSNIVRSWDTHGRWNGQGDYRTTRTISGSDPVVVLIQEKNHGAILAAARLR